MRKKSYIISILSIILLVGLSGCSFPWQKKAKVVTPDNSNITATTTPDAINSQDNATGEIKKFKDIDELQTFLTQHASTNNLSVVKTGQPTLALGNTSQALTPSAPATADYSSTNVQVAGVDEADIMKNDGTYIYLLDYNDLYIIKAKPAGTAAILTKITFKSRPQEFYISGDSLVVFGYDTQILNDKTYQSFKRQNPYTFLKVFDITDRKNPKQVRDLNLEGNYSDSRLVGDYLYFITNNYQNYLVGEPLLPRVLDNGSTLPEKCTLSAKCYSPNVFYFNIPYQSYNFTSVTALNIKNASEAISGDVYLLSGNQNLYVSPTNLYITYTNYLNEADIERDVTISLVKDRMPADSQAKIAKIEAVESFILGDDEKKAKIYNLVQTYIANLNTSEQAALQTEIDTLLKKTLADKAKDMEQTVIHKIAFSGSQLEYKATGHVSGHVLNQFSMDENNGYFRIATTRSQSWSSLAAASKDSYNNVYVLDDKLQTVGLLENLAVGEQIYSARFVGDRAYLVTYKQTDPLFAIDLKDSKAPRVLGELKLPGYSTYLQAYSDNVLLGFGRDTEVCASGAVVNKGLKLGLFDVSNPGAPKELDSFVTGDQYSDSIALSDHKAFLISSAKNLISIPAVLRSGPFGDKVEFSGALVFGVSNDKLKLRGRIDHSDTGNYTTPDYWSGIRYFDNSVKRSLYIDNILYTFSNKFLKINDLNSTGDSLALIKTIDLLPNSSKDFEVTPISVAVPAVSTSSAGVNLGSSSTGPILETVSN